MVFVRRTRVDPNILVYIYTRENPHQTYIYIYFFTINQIHIYAVPLTVFSFRKIDKNIYEFSNVIEFARTRLVYPLVSDDLKWCSSITNVCTFY